MMKKRTIDVSEDLFEENLIGNPWFWRMVKITLHLTSLTNEFADFFCKQLEEAKIPIEREQITIFHNQRQSNGWYPDCSKFTTIEGQLRAFSSFEDFTFISDQVDANNNLNK
jgi:hypothetical protein